MFIGRVWTNALNAMKMKMKIIEGSACHTILTVRVYFYNIWVVTFWRKFCFLGREKWIKFITDQISNCDNKIKAVAMLKMYFVYIETLRHHSIYTAKLMRLCLGKPVCLNFLSFQCFISKNNKRKQKFCLINQNYYY